MPPLESSLGQNASPTRNESFQSLQSTLQVSPSPKKKSPPKPTSPKRKSPSKPKSPKKKKSMQPKEPSSEEESAQESPVENKRKPKLTKASFQTDSNILDVLPLVVVTF